MEVIMDVKKYVIEEILKTFEYGCKYGDVATTKEIIEIQDDVNLASLISGKTFLMIACQYGLTELVKLLLSKGVNINQKDIFNHNALWYACFSNRLEIFSLLCNAGAEIVKKQSLCTQNILFFACENCDEKIVDFLLNLGFDVNVRDFCGNTPLFVAVKKNKLGVVKVLLENGAIINTKNMFGETPILVAAMNNNIRIVDYLVAFDGNENQDFVTKLITAIQLNNA